MAKRLVCERVLSGGQDGYDSVVVAPESMEQSQENLKSLREDKRALRDANTALTREIGELVERILGCQHDLHETLQELASFGEDSPYAPSQAVSHFQAPAAVATTESEDDKALQLAIAKLESRVNEIEEFQAASAALHGFHLSDYSAHHATFTIDLEQIAAQYMDASDAPSFVSYCAQVSSNAPLFWLKLNWTVSCELLSIEMPFMSEHFEDIVDLAIEDNSPSFCIRELSRRLHCFALRFRDFTELTRQKPSISLSSRAFDSVVGFTISGSPNWVVGVSVPSEYPHMGIALLHVTPSAGSPLDCTSLRAQRFPHIIDSMDAAVALIPQ